MNNQTKPKLLFGFPYWLQSVLFWVGFISIIIMGFMHEAREYVAIGVALCVVSLILRKKYMSAFTSFMTFSIFWWVFLEWGIKGSLIASLIYLPIVIVIVTFQLIKMKKEQPQQFEKLVKLLHLNDLKDKFK